MRTIKINPIPKFLIAQTLNIFSILIGISLLAFFLINYSTANVSIYKVLSDYPTWLFNSLQGNFGVTLYGEKIIDTLVLSFIKTLQLSLSAIIVSIILAVLVSWTWYRLDNVTLFNGLIKLLLVISTIPLFLASFIVSLTVNYISIDIYDNSLAFIEKLIFYTAPVIMLAIFDGVLSESVQLVKSQLDSIKNEPFIIALDLRGNKRRKHIFRHISFGLLDLMSSKFVHFWGGAIIVEILFNIHGLGYLGYRSIQVRDFNLFLSVVFFTAITLLSINLTIKLFTVFANPIYRKRIFIKNSFFDLIKI